MERNCPGHLASMSISRSYRAIAVVIVGAAFRLGGCSIREAATPPRSGVESSRRSSTIWTQSNSGGNSLPLSGSVDTWSSGHRLGINSWPESVSCPTTMFCVTVDAGGYEYTFSGGKWSAGKFVSTMTHDALNSVSCPSAIYCVAVDASGYEYTFSGGTWSSGQRIETKAFDSLNSVSCPTTMFCVAVDGNGYVYTFSGGTWSSGLQIGAVVHDSLDSVSCPTTKYCVATDKNGYAYTFSGGTW